MPPQDIKASSKASGQSGASGTDSKKRPAGAMLPGLPSKKHKTSEKNESSKGRGVGGGQTNANQKQNSAPPKQSMLNGKSKQSRSDKPGSTEHGRNEEKNARDTSTNRPRQSQKPRERGQQPSDSRARKPAKEAPSENMAAKRNKMHAIRSIPVQESKAALKDGELDLQAFLNARSFEMKALDESMRRSKTSHSRRAFQQVPFSLRRRSAAHNPMRVPKRLQKRARKEMADDNTPTINSRTREPASTRAYLRAETARRLQKLAYRRRKQKLLKKNLDERDIVTRLARPKIKRNTLNEPPIVVKKFTKRQLNKTWLPTHLWHAKRARITPPLEPLWRFAIPLTRTQKSGWPAHRALWKDGAIAWDMSYMSTISLCGTDNNVRHVLRGLGLTMDNLWNDSKRGKAWRSGKHHENLTLSRKVEDCAKIIGPATIIWNPETQSGETAKPNDGQTASRRLFIRTHPSIFLETFNEMLRLVKGLNPHPFIEDLRHEIGSIDITGPTSTEALACLLKPYHNKPDFKEPHSLEFEALATQNLLPCHVIDTPMLAFSVMDPRLHYPPRRTRPSNAADGPVEGNTDDQKPKPFALFDRDARFKASQLPSARSINQRRGKYAKHAPGVSLEPTIADPAIPIILLAGEQQNTSGTWTLMMPWKCVTPVWQVLVHCPGNPMFGGLKETRQLAFESGTPWFPADIPGTDAGIKWELDQRRERKKAWDRMPKGKRGNYETLDLGAGRKGEVGEGWNCDFEILFGLDKADMDPGLADVQQADVKMTDADKVEGDGTTVNSMEQTSRDPVHPLAKISQLTRAKFNLHLSPKAGPPPLGSLVAVKLTMLGRGVPSACARIYRLPTTKPASTQAEVPATEPPTKTSGRLPVNLRDQWLAQIPKKTKASPAKLKHNSAADIDVDTRRRLLAQELISPKSNSDTINGHPMCPDAEDLIGFVTTGGYNLRCGKAQGIGSLSAEKAIPEWKSKMNNKDGGVLCIVRNSGENVGWLAKWDPV